MPSLLEKVSILNSAVRTVLGLVLVGGLATAGWYGYTTFYAKEIAARENVRKLQEASEKLQMVSLELRAKEQEVLSLQEKVEKLDTAMRLLKVDHRVAQLDVLDQVTDPETNDVISRVQFQELNEQGEPIGEAREFQIQGDIIYIDSWIVKFDDEYIEQADLDRKTSLVLFRRLFGEFQQPSNAHVLDPVGGRPQVYGRGGKMSEFESKIWSDFWTVANDASRQNELGVRAAHGEAPSIKLQKGKAYRITLRASGGLTVVPAGDIIPRKPAA